jgi:hypothetical protein
LAFPAAQRGEEMASVTARKVMKRMGFMGCIYAFNAGSVKGLSHLEIWQRDWWRGVVKPTEHVIADELAV